jgi:hypothetical protein
MTGIATYPSLRDRPACLRQRWRAPWAEVPTAPGRANPRRVQTEPQREGSPLPACSPRGREGVVKLGHYYRHRPDAIDHFELRGLDEPLERPDSKRSDALAPGAMTDLPRSPGAMTDEPVASDAGARLGHL